MRKLSKCKNKSVNCVTCFYLSVTSVNFCTGVICYKYVILSGPARPLGELGDRLVRQALRGTKMQLRKRKAPKK